MSSTSLPDIVVFHVAADTVTAREIVRVLQLEQMTASMVVLSTGRPLAPISSGLKMALVTVSNLALEAGGLEAHIVEIIPTTSITLLALEPDVVAASLPPPLGDLPFKRITRISELRAWATEIKKLVIKEKARSAPVRLPEIKRLMASAPLVAVSAPLVQPPRCTIAHLPSFIMNQSAARTSMTGWTSETDRLAGFDVSPQLPSAMLDSDNNDEERAARLAAALGYWIAATGTLGAVAYHSDKIVEWAAQLGASIKQGLVLFPFTMQRDQRGKLDQILISAVSERKFAKHTVIQIEVIAERDLIGVFVDTPNLAERLKRDFVANPFIALRSGSAITMALDGDGLTVSNPIRRATWAGKSFSESFSVVIPSRTNRHEFQPMVWIWIDGVKPLRLSFRVVAVASGIPQDKEVVGDKLRSGYGRTFVSYAHADEGFVRGHVEDLEAGGADVFWDRHLRTGDYWQDRLVEEMRSCDTFVLIWTENAARSKEVAKEINFVRALEPRPRILQIRLPFLNQRTKKWEYVAVPDGLGAIQYKDVIPWSSVQSLAQSEHGHDTGVEAISLPVKIYERRSAKETRYIPRSRR